MPRRVRNARGFTGVELLIVVVVLGIIGGSVAGTHAYAQRRAAERVVAGDLDAYAQAQVSAREERGRFATHAELLAGGFGWSGGVEAVEVRTADDRFFVRVRHTRTGYACALDLSPATAGARNRKVCRASAADPALAAPPGIAAAAPRGDTATVARPPAPLPPEEALLLPPEVGDAPDAVIPPGGSRVVLFSLTNRSGEARSFTFGVSSAAPEVVPAPSGPADARLAAGEVAEIPVTVSVATGALAGAAAHVELRAADAGDHAYAGSGGVRVSAALVLAAPAVAAPADQVRDPGETFTVPFRVRNRTNAPRVLRFRADLPAGSALSLAAPVSDQAFEALEERVVAVTYRLSAAADGGTRWSAGLSAADRDAAAAPRGSAAVGVASRLVLAAPAVTAFAERTEAPGAQFTAVFRVQNRSNAPRDIRLTPGSASPELVPVSPAGALTQRIGRGEVASVPVTYRLGPGATCDGVHAALLRAEDAEEGARAGSASGLVRTATVLAAPAVAAPAPRSAPPGASFVATWQVANRSNCEREVRIEVLPDADAEVSGAVGAGVLRMKAFEQRALEAGYRVRDSSVHQAVSRPRVRAADAAAAAHATTGAMVLTTALRLCAPRAAGPLAAPAQPQQPGTLSTVSYRVTNCSNAARTFTLQAVSSNPAAVTDPADPAPVTLPAFGSAEVAFTYAVPELAPGTASSDLVLVARDAADVSLLATADFRAVVAVVLNAPVLGPFAARTVLPGAEGASSAVLTSRSNVGADFCFATSVRAGSAGAGAVVPLAPAAPGCVRLGPYGSATVTQTVAAADSAEHAWTNLVEVRAHDAARPALAVAQSFPVTAGLVLAAPALAVPATPPPVLWLIGQDRTVEYPVRNRGNSARELCVAGAPAGPELASAAAPPCAVVAARGTHVFRHTLRGSGAGEGTVGVRAYDRLAPEHEARASFAARVVDARPVARWVPPSPVQLRRWADFDASGSFSPVGARITRYVWTWGLFNQRWTGWRFEPGGSGVATDETAAPVVRRAWDLRGTFQVCLAVEDEAGRRSAPECAPVTVRMPTRARLAFRYRGWWYDPDGFCIDLPWDSQCSRAHGNARWEILLTHSQGEVPIRRAWARVRVDYWQTDDQFPRGFTYAGNAETLPYAFTSGGGTVTYDFHSDRHRPGGSVESGRWRVLDTDGTPAFGWPAAPALDRHPLVLNANLGSATGAFDGGPHWVPDQVWITLLVEDAEGKVTEQSGHLDHKRSEWRGDECINGTMGLDCMRGYERLVPPAEPPVVTLHREDLGGGTYRFTGSGVSPDGRVVDHWWEVSRLHPDGPPGGSPPETHRAEVLQVQPGACETVEVALVYVDERGERGRARDRVTGGDPRRCGTGGLAP